MAEFLLIIKNIRAIAGAFYVSRKLVDVISRSHNFQKPGNGDHKSDKRQDDGGHGHDECPQKIFSHPFDGLIDAVELRFLFLKFFLNVLFHKKA